MHALEAFLLNAWAIQYVVLLLQLTNRDVEGFAVVAAGHKQVPAITVQVWNDVIDVDTQNSLHEASCQIGLGHRVFSRKKKTKLRRGDGEGDHGRDYDDDDDASRGPTNHIEKTIDDILTELGDTSAFVEYWTRQEWRSIEAHADVDEYLAKRQQKQNQNPEFRYPDHGHVLYLKVGEKVRGPTCVFPGRRSGGDLLRNIEPSSSALASMSSSSRVELVTVPAVPGRLLRFQGDCLHAVPRPTDLWLLTFVQGAPQFEPESEWGRSVILFNTWSDKPPADVPISCQISTKDDEVVDDSIQTLSSTSCRDKSSWGDESIDDGPLPSLDGDDEEEGISAKIWLLGDLKRRDHAMKTLKLEAPQRLVQALHQPTTVSRILLQRPE